MTVFLENKLIKMQVLKTFRMLGLHNRLAFYSLALIVVQTLVMGVVSLFYLESELESQIGKRAMAVAVSVSHAATIKQGLLEQDSASIQQYVESVRSEIGARFIVVGDVNGVRFSHPDSHKIGKVMVGGDNSRALLQGEAYISKAFGTLGMSLRAKHPVFSATGNIIGIVSVGYLEEDIGKVIQGYEATLLSIFLVILSGGIFLTIYSAKRYNDDIFGMAPEEIARTYTERKAVLESIVEGVLVLNVAGQVNSVNQVALDVLGVEDEAHILGQEFVNFLPNHKFLFAKEAQDSWRDIEVDANHKTLIMAKTPLLINGENCGVVVSFRLKDDIVVLSRKLSQIQQFSTMLRVQTHEYSNKLNTIGGLIQIGSVDEALELIVKESSGYQSLIEFLIKAVPDPILAGLILGKYNVASESGVEFVIDREGSLSAVPKHIPQEKLVTILGNLIDNAFEASAANTQRAPRVTLSMTDIGQDIIFEITDSGTGITDEVKENMFSLGETSKTNPGHGIGMYLVKNNIEQLGASLSITEEKTGGSVFTVYIPKKNGTSKNKAGVADE